MILATSSRFAHAGDIGANVPATACEYVLPMRNRNVWRFAAVVLVLGLLAFGLAPDRSSPERAPSRTVNRPGASPSAADTQPRAGSTGSSIVAIAPSAPAVSRPSTSGMSAPTPSPIPVELRVQVPPEVAVGEVFQARVDADASGGVGQLVFALTYDKTRLEWITSAAGNLAQMGDGLAEFAAEEPSEGNIQVSLNAGNGRSISGSGNLATFEFRAIKRGTSPLVLQNLTVFDGGGTATVDSSVLYEARVDIH